MKYNTNFVKTKQGNGIKEGSVLQIKIDGAHFFSGAIYQNNFPVIAFQTIPGDNDTEILVKRKDKSLKGKAVLKVRAYDSQWRGAGWNDEFVIF
jgi:hypothetical protein